LELWSSFLVLGRLEDLLDEIVQVGAPGLGFVAVGIDVPDVGNLVFVQVGVEGLAEADEAVLVAAGEVEELDLFLGGGGVGE
jgi:hypothetical protein